MWHLFLTIDISRTQKIYYQIVWVCGNAREQRHRTVCFPRIMSNWPMPKRMENAILCSKLSDAFIKTRQQKMLREISPWLEVCNWLYFIDRNYQISNYMAVYFALLVAHLDACTRKKTKVKKLFLNLFRLQGVTDHFTTIHFCSTNSRAEREKSK